LKYPLSAKGSNEYQMEQINAVELRDSSIYPDSSVLSGILGASYPAYEALLALFAEMGMEHGWRYYKDGKTWLCKVQKKKKTVVWMSAWKDYMQATVYVPCAYLNELKGMELRESVKEKILSAKQVGKSLPCMFEIRNTDILDDLKKVMLFKESLLSSPG